MKREPHGAGSEYVHLQVRVGDLLEIAAPRGTFVLQPGDSPVLLVSAGVGATPVLAMLHALVAEGRQRDVWWLHGARGRAEEPFAAEVELARSGVSVPWSEEYGSLLALAEECDVPVRWSCRTGVCHTCETALNAGTVSYAPDPIDLPGAGDVLICCARPIGGLVLDL